MRLLWLILGWVAAILGAIGLFLPVVPTVPFLLVAVFSFARSSRWLAARIMRDPRFRPADPRMAQARRDRAHGSNLGYRCDSSGGRLDAVAGSGSAHHHLSGADRAIVGAWLITRPET